MQLGKPDLTHRPEIDGLRAIAVLPVILYHAGWSTLPGGFLGVDVFFVISGYLIARILLAEIDAGHFSILKFYERRARRILPALFVVIAATIPFAMLWMPPESLNAYFKSITATALFFSNVHFWQSSGYFRPDADEQPLLHTWSLAVEEQFYVFFPFMLWLAVRFFGTRLPVLFFGLVVVGFALCLYQFSESESAAFYLIHARAWELLAGVSVVVLERRTSVLANLAFLPRQILSAVGLIAILTGFFVITAKSQVPGWPTLLPVAGTALLIASANGATLVGQALSWRPIVGIGLISYSAYLWHHPLFAFARLRSLNEPSLGLMLALALVAMVLAYLSWRYVERPFRQKGVFSQRTIFAAALASIAGFGVFAVGAEQSGLAVKRFTTEQLALIAPSLSKVENCDWLQPVDGFDLIKFCPMGKADFGAPVLLWGDSHAQALFDEMGKALEAKGIPGLYLDNSRCFRIPGVVTEGRNTTKDTERCEKTRDALFAYLNVHPPRAIIVNMRWTLRMFPVPGAEDSVGFDNGEGGIESEDARINLAQTQDGSWTTAGEPKAAAIKTLLQKLSEVAPLIVIGPVPEVGWHVGNSNFKSIVIRGEALRDITTSHEQFLSRNGFVLNALDEAQAATRFTRIEPAAIFCNSLVKGRCVAQFQGKAYYSDDDHVSDLGARLIVEQAVSKLP